MNKGHKLKIKRGYYRAKIFDQFRILTLKKSTIIITLNLNLILGANY